MDGNGEAMSVLLKYVPKEVATNILDDMREAGLLRQERSSFGNPDINSVVAAFKQSFGATRTTKYDRFAANRLIKQNGAELVVFIIQTLAANKGKYAPVVGSISQLEDKWVNVLNYLHNNSAQSEVVRL